MGVLNYKKVDLVITALDTLLGSDMMWLSPTEKITL